MRGLFTLLSVAMLLTPSLALAHEGHDHRTLGVVSALHENHLEVKDKAGKTVTFTIEKATKIRRGKTVLRVAEIKVGDRVVVISRQIKDKAGKVTVNVREVQVGVTATTK